MTRIRLTAVVVAVALVCGCATPPRVDRLYQSADLPSRSLKLALVISDVTKASVKETNAAVGINNTDNTRGMRAEPTKPFDTLNQVLRSDFDSIVVVDGVEAAKASGADLIGVLDVRTKMHTERMSKTILLAVLTMDLYFFFVPDTVTNIDVDLSLMTLDQKPIDDLHVAAHRKQKPMDGNTFSMMFGAVTEEAGIRFENALGASAALASFALKHEKPQAVAATEAAKPAEVPRSDVYAPAYEAPENPNNYALVIGIEGYASLPPAQFAERDAQAMRRHLVALGYPERNILYLAGERAGRAGIEKYVEAWLPKNVNDESRVLVYFSGHGAPDPESKQAYLVPWDGDPKFLKNTGYPIKRLYQKLGALKAKEVILVMDSCFSGEGGRSVIAKGTRPLVTQVDTGLTTSANLVVLSASHADEIAGAKEDQGQGLFTYYLLKALNETKGEATVSQLYDSLLPRVRDSARRENRDQTPQLMPAALGGRGAIKLR